jgi:transcriptional regulator with XRE-family HTH domain
VSPIQVGRRVRALRQRKGLSQLELARRAKITQPYLAQIEARVRKNPSLKTLQRLAKALGVTVVRLLR